MSFRSGALEDAVVRIVVVMTVTGAALVAVSMPNRSLIHAQAPGAAAKPATSSRVRLPNEATGIDGIAQALISAFDQVDIVALGENHGRKVDSDLRMAVVRHPDFARKARSIVVEFGSTAEQATLDRYIRGENLSRTQLQRIWATTSQSANGVWESPVYAEFFAAVREVNGKLPAAAQIRVLAGDPPAGSTASRDASALSVLKEHVLQKNGKALVVYGAGHFYRTRDYADDIGIARTLEIEYPGRTFVVIPVGGPVDLPAGMTLRIHPDYQKFDRALQTTMRPVLVPLVRAPFRDFTAEEFLGAQVLTCAGTGSCRSVFQGSPLTLGQMADALLYVGAEARAPSVKP